MFKSKRLLKVVLIIVVILTATYFVWTDYIIYVPGSIEDLKMIVSVNEEAAYENQGTFYLVTVSSFRARLLYLLWGMIHPDVDVKLLSEVIPPEMSEQEYRLIMERRMTESKLMAQAVALQRLGYNAEIISKGVVVDGFVEESPAYGILEKGDIIIAVDGHSVKHTDDAIAAVRDRSVGAPVFLTVLRGEEKFEVSITTHPSTNNPDWPVVGVYLNSNWEITSPVDVQMETGKIGGPSAGVMFVLEIMNQLIPEDLTGGHLIAGTGTIDVNEKIGAIGGVFQKVVAAEKAGAEYFIVPEENYEEASKASREIVLVPVSTLQDVIDFLNSITQLGEVENSRSSHHRWAEFTA